MKRFNIGLGLMGILVAGFIGCTKDVIEKSPLENLGSDLVFDSKDSLGVLADQFLNNIYSSLPRGYNRVDSSLLDAGDDDAVSSNNIDRVQYFSTGTFTSINLPDNVWDANYAGIRKVNLFLANIDVVPLREAGLKDRWKAEARGLRALFYFELVKRWGGVPLLGDRVLTATDNLALPKNSFDECITYINSELEAIQPKLFSPKQASATTVYYGRFTRGAALALKSRLLLYAASPLWNTHNDLTKWAAAAAAAKVIIDSVVAGNFPYALSTSTAITHYTTATVTNLAPSATLSTYTTNLNKFLNVFTVRSTNEFILGYMLAPNSDQEKFNEPVGYTRGGLGKTNPTQELVNEFEMSNGKMITDPSSNYDPARPYFNRDPRLAGTVFFDSLYWINRYVRVYDGGPDRPFGYQGSNSGQTRTGYYMRKFLTSGSSATAYSNQNHIFPIFRYAEILLNYAEALNESSGPVQGVYDAVNAIRTRVGMPVLNVGLSQPNMRNAIQHERRVELAFEEQRFFDIRRWKMAGTVLNGTLHGIQIIWAPATNTASFQVVPVVSTSFDVNKMYLYPIPYKEAVNNPQLQNPNW